jgi:hypothetical protein
MMAVVELQQSCSNKSSVTLWLKKLRISNFILRFYACAEIAVNAVQFTPLCKSQPRPIQSSRLVVSVGWYIYIMEQIQVK